MTDYMINVNDLSETTKENSQHVFTLSDGKMKKVPVEEFSGGGITADVIFDVKIPIDDPESAEGTIEFREGFNYDGLCAMIESGICPVYGGGICFYGSEESIQINLVMMPSAVTRFDEMGGIIFVVVDQLFTSQTYAIILSESGEITVAVMGS